MPDDRNFDDLAHRFRRNVYASLKGQIRLQVLQRDFAEFLPASVGEGWRVLDAGGGQGQMAAYFAELGHHVLLCDISAEMLKLSRELLADRDLLSQVDIQHAAIQQVLAKEQSYDLVVCHAVLEWVAEPQQLLAQLASRIKPGGMLSLIYYNVNGLIYKNLLRTNFKKIRAQQWQGYRGSLTPTQPLYPEEVLQWASESRLQILCESGIRVFYDYVFNLEDRSRDPEGIIEMELAHSRQAPYKHLGRYIHLLCRKSD